MPGVTAFRSHGRRAWATWILTLALLAAAIVTITSRAREDAGDPRSGSALNDGATFTFSKKNVPVDQRFVLMLNDVVNDSATPVTILRVEPLSEPDSEIAILERLELAPRGQGRPSVEQGSHLTYPPGSSSDYSRAGCSYQELREPNGFVLPPNNPNDVRALMVMTIRTVGPGKTSFEVGRVVYEHEGAVHAQDVELVVDLTVSRSAKPLRPSAEEAPCAHGTYLVPQPPAGPP